MAKYFILFVLFFAVSISLTAKDDLVKLQKKEEKRRKKIKSSVIKITNENVIKLSKNSKKKISRLSNNNSYFTLSNMSKNINKSQSEGENKNKEYWKNEKISIENSIRFYEEKVKSLTNKLNKLSSDYLTVDFPPSQRQIKLDMDKTRQALSKSKLQVPFFKKKLEDLYDRARRESVPPGWLR